MVRSAADANYRNKRVSFKSEVQDLFIKLDIKPILTLEIVILKINLENCNDGVSTKTRF